MTNQKTSDNVRVANWLTLEESEGIVTIVDRRLSQQHQLSPSASFIWQQVVDGFRVSEIVQAIEQTFPGAEDVYLDVTDTIDDFREKQLLLFSDPELEMEYCGRIVRKLDVPLALQWQLEKLRQFWVGTTSAQARAPIESNLQELLSEQALEKAKIKDVDAAGDISDSTTFEYSTITQCSEISIVTNDIIGGLQQLIPEAEKPIAVSGGAVYLPGAHMGWHSNHSRSDYRIYCIWSEKESSNFFRYQHPKTGKIITEYEAPGWNVNYFQIPSSPERLWHCIGANSIRFSLGFRF